MRTIFSVLLVSIFLTACGEQFRGDFVGTAFPGNTDCGIEPGDITYDVRVAGGISSNRASLRIIELKPQGAVQRGTGPAEAFAKLFRGFEIKADVINKETIQSEGKDTIYRVRDRNNQTLDNIDDEGRYVQSVTDEFDIVTTSGTVNRARDEVTSMEVERKTKIRSSITNEELECTLSLFIPSMSLEK